MPDQAEWAKAIAEAREPLPMEPEIWAAGADLDTAHFSARMLRQNGYYLVRPDDLEWDDIHRFNRELRKGQSVFEDAGGFFIRALKALLRIETEDREVMTYRRAAKAMLEGSDA